MNEMSQECWIAVCINGRESKFHLALWPFKFWPDQENSSNPSYIYIYIYIYI